MAKSIKERVEEITSSFVINYLSEYRWKKDRISNLSAEDFLKEHITQALKDQRQEIVEMLEKDSETLSQIIGLGGRDSAIEAEHIKKYVDDIINTLKEQ